MGEARAEITIERSVDDVWAMLGDFSDLRWFPGIESWTMDGDVRTTVPAGRNLQHLERLVHLDETAHRYTYETIGYVGDTIVELDGGTYDLTDQVGNHRGTITVQEVGPARAHVTYDVELDDDAMLARMVDGYQRVLVSVKRELEQ